uniref:Zinc knuckle CX2CX4HX4C n=1 Tax=Tanacetum cinerariifolium TaxID=118510 RepID=A0A699JTJ5_TANCI|nr:zinc knuckle CX2CX4HX4C [Tanacetum cinerariifolium]
MGCRVNEETDMGKCGVADDVSNDTGRNKKHKECEQGNTSGILVEEVLVDDCKVVGNSGLEEEQCKGSKNWELTLCGYFMGYKMIINELRSNLRIMWGRYGFKDIVDYNNGVFFMKFRHEEGLNQVVNSGP